ncbi:MAG: hypothetical protein LQ350_008519 [Teloschistes chrysophthalmus]|nr:MAG: hypothetical protein LQ350_008519 [Niorma chrysophthalma]
MQQASYNVDRQQEPAPASKLLNLPPEILASVVQYVQFESLGSVALANSTLSQLARSRQFKRVDFDYCPIAMAIVDRLQQEATERLRNGDTRKLRIGPFIRAIDVTLIQRACDMPDDMMKLDLLDMQDDSSAATALSHATKYTTALEVFDDTHLAAVLGYLSDRALLPNLKSLFWEDNRVPRPAILDIIGTASVQDLYIHIDPLRDESLYKNTPGRSLRTTSWALRNLEVFLVGSSMSPGIVEPCINMIRACHATLQSLTWHVRTWEGPCKGHKHFKLSTPWPRFPRLRHLRLRSLLLADTAPPQGLIHEDTVSLELGSRFDEAAPLPEDYWPLLGPGYLRSLENLVLGNRHQQEGAGCDLNWLQFLKANPDISKLMFRTAASPALWETDVFPYLSENFTNLKSLSLVWDAKDFSDRAMACLSKLTTLEQLHLTVETPNPKVHQWLIDHGRMREYLRSLRALRKLAFTQDAYDDDEDHEWYGRFGSGLLHEYHEDQSGAASFMEKHKVRMIQHTAQYVQQLPQLEWLFMGMLYMVVEKNPQTGEKVAKANRVDTWHDYDENEMIDHTKMEQIFGTGGNGLY